MARGREYRAEDRRVGAASRRHEHSTQGMCRYRNNSRFSLPYRTQRENGSESGFLEMQAGGSGACGQAGIVCNQNLDPARPAPTYQGACKGGAAGRAVMAKNQTRSPGQAIERGRRIGQPLLVAEQQQGGQIP